MATGFNASFWRTPYSSAVACFLAIGFLAIAPIEIEAYAAPLGSQSIPEELPKTTILLERRNKTVFKPVEIQLYSLDPDKGYQKNQKQLYFQDQPEYSPIGSAVLINHHGVTCLVTASHVATSVKEGDLYFRIPSKKELKWRRTSFEENKQKSGYGWFIYEADDIAVTFLDLDDKGDDVRLVSSETFIAMDEEIKTGDDVFVVGFPSSVTADLNVVRNGMISAKPSKGTLLIDTAVFNGNSGGPVFWKPATGFKMGAGIKWEGPEIRGRDPKLLGIVTGYLPFRDSAISVRTGRELLISEQNSGLAKAVSASKIREILDGENIATAIAKLKIAKSHPAAGAVQ